MLNKYDLPRSKWENLIDEWIFNDIDRKMLKMRLLDGARIQEIADEINLSIDQTKRRLYRSQNRLFKKVDKIKNL